MSRKKRSAKKKLILLIKPLYCELDEDLGKPEDLGYSFAPIKDLHMLSLLKWVDPNGEYQKSYGTSK